jgi:TRAP-type mannitol/chloroaromatic compound transport system permease small subunit
MWLTAAMVLITVFNVFERYALKQNTVYLGELNWHFFSIIFLFGAAYTLKHDGHVRVDLLYHRLSKRGKAWINLLGTILFMLPICFVIIYTSLNSSNGFESSFVGQAWIQNERSSVSGGLPARYLIKAALPIGFLLLALQGVGEIIRNGLILKEKQEG